MAKEGLKKEAGKWLRKYLLCSNCEKKCNCIESNSYCEQQVLKAYVDSAEPRDKRIAELEAQIEKMKNWCNCKNYQQCLIELAEQGKGMNSSENCRNCKKWEIRK